MKKILKGNLSDNPLSDLLTGLQRGGATGTLQIASDSQFKKVMIINGDIVFASSDAGDEQLGEILLKKGEITLEEYNQSTALSVQKDQSMEKALVQLGYMTPEELSRAVKYQVEEIILGLFALKEGRFEFHDAFLSGYEQREFRFRAADLIYKGIIRIDNFTHLKQLCPCIDDVLNFSLAPGDVFKDVALDDIDKKILSFVNGLYSVKVILLFSPLNDFGTLRRLCAFLGAGLIKIKRSDEEASELPEDLVSGAPDKTSAQSIEKIEEPVNEIETETDLNIERLPDTGGSDMKTEPGVDREAAIVDEDKEPTQKKIMYISFIAIIFIILVIAFAVFKEYKKEPESPDRIVSKKIIPLPPLREDLFERMGKGGFPGSE